MSTTTDTNANLKKLQAYCFANGIKVPWDKILAVGIYQDLKLVLPDGLMTNRQLFRAIGHHVNSPSYLKRIQVGKMRYGLKYKPTSRVTLSEAGIARHQFFKLHSSHNKPKNPNAKAPKIGYKSRKHQIPSTKP